MKILLFIDSLNSGGAQRQMVNLAIGFKEKGHEVLVMNYHELNFFKELLDKHDIPTKTIIEKNYIKRLFKIRKAIRLENPDAVLSFLSAGNFIATFAGFPKRNWRLVVGERNAKPDILKSMKLIFFIFFHLFTDYVVANSYTNLNLIKKANPFLKKEKLKVIYNIINVERKESINYKSNSFTKIVIAARYHPQKNLEGLINAVSSLPKAYLDKIKIEWYGSISEDNSYYQSNLLLIKKNNLESIIHLYDRTPEIFEKYATADFVGLFSHYEGFPNVICEAMALGKPIICTMVSDIPLFLKDSFNGFLCKSDSESIKASLIKAIDSSEVLRAKFGKNNKKLIKQNFEKSQIINQYLNILHKR